MELINEIQKRKTFGIISHPDAGKTTLTEKLLLFGGAIHTAGEIKAKKANRYAASDFMEIEKQRGISVATSVMGFEYQKTKINLLDTPGHKDFSEDTYRTLTAVDSVIMIIDCVKGVETQTHKLMEVCRMRNIPIITFINKCDREGREPIDLIDEIEDKLQLNICPLTWPIGLGSHFQGIYNFQTKKILHYNTKLTKDKQKNLIIDDIYSNQTKELINELELKQLYEDIELVSEMYPTLSQEDYKTATTSPLFFGSALNKFGVQELLNWFTNNAPEPQQRETNQRIVIPNEEKVDRYENVHSKG